MSFVVKVVCGNLV
ncbi:hypothetical protein M2G70_24315 [Vibrio vulnificus]|nr:hypothetical protein [Vibrio vulnificus]MCU8120514.1 hypothetical protein [Vibrio vulnificus]MCU8163770.1 hypothetical protein [Vibrio vulnificus]MCU8168285.1 hypothetical protein [Vibrio vulnificus]MCU8168608.1 hypothetical protein [Vibrio vulnificus]